METYDPLTIRLFVLGKQHLLDKGGRVSISEVVSDVCGLHATELETPYLSMFSRLHGFRREHLEKELYSRRSMAKVSSVRNTLYIYNKDFFPIAMVATRDLRERYFERYLEFGGLDERSYAALSSKVREYVRGREADTKSIRNAVDPLEKRIAAVVRLMCNEETLIRTHPRKYALFEDYFPDIDLERFDSNASIRKLTRSYISAFGPVSFREISWWTGFSIARTRGIVDTFIEELSRVRVDGMRDELLLPEAQLAELGNVDEGHDNVRFLPRLDPYMMAYKTRERYVDQRHYHHVFDLSGNATSTVVVNGRPIGVWDVDRPEGVIKVHLFARVDGETEEALMANAAELGRFIGLDEEKTELCKSMRPLDKGTYGRFMSPLASR